MTRDERIEAAARAICAKANDNWDDIPESKQDWTNKRGQFNGRFRDVNEPYRLDYLAMVTAAIDAAYPELAGENPTHWLAPMEMTDDMASASMDAEIYCDICDIDIALTREGLVKAARLGWSAARDVYLKEGGE